MRIERTRGGAGHQPTSRVGTGFDLPELGQDGRRTQGYLRKRTRFAQRTGSDSRHGWGNRNAMSLAFAVPAFATWHEDLWDTILDLSALLENESWAIVGGQAVIGHGLAHDVTAPRLSRESDGTGRLVTTADSMGAVTRAMRDLGFSTEAPTSLCPLFRFTREPDANTGDARTQVWTAHVVGKMSNHGGDQALARRVPYQVTKGLRAPWVPVPDLLASIVYEAAQFGADTAEPFVHARDAAFLVSLIRDPIRESARLTPDDQRALRSLDAAVGDRAHHVWAQLVSDRDAFTTWRLLLSV